MYNIQNHQEVSNIRVIFYASNNIRDGALKHATPRMQFGG